jgi:hypothetical protein
MSKVLIQNGDDSVTGRRRLRVTIRKQVKLDTFYEQGGFMAIDLADLLGELGVPFDHEVGSFREDGTFVSYSGYQTGG